MVQRVVAVHSLRCLVVLVGWLARVRGSLLDLRHGGGE